MNNEVYCIKAEDFVLNSELIFSVDSDVLIVEKIIEYEFENCEIFKLKCNNNELNSRTYIKNKKQSFFKILNSKEYFDIHNYNLRFVNQFSFPEDCITLCPISEYIYDNGFIKILSDDMKTLNECSNIIHNIPHKRICDLWNYGQCFSSLLHDKNLHLILKCIFDGDYHCSTFSSNTLTNQTKSETFVHCDYPYHNLRNFPKKTILGVQCNWTLDDFTRENGATMYKQFSHKNLSNPESNYPLDKIFTAPKGTLIIYLATLWHSESVNFTDKPRSALLANFTPNYINMKDESGNMFNKLNLI